MRERGSRLPTTASTNALLPAGGRLPTTSVKSGRHRCRRSSERCGALRRIARAREPSEIARSGAPVGGAVALWPAKLVV